MPETVRIAAAGDVHCRPAQREHAIRAFAGLDAKADVLLLAGDLTTHGQPEQAEVLAEACAPLDMPIVAVLGNHDWHCNTVEECLPIWEKAGIQVLDRSHCILDVDGLEVGIAGVKGFVGGFPGSHLPDFGEPSLRGIYAEAGEEAAALDRALRDISHCPVRVALLHYAPTSETLIGEPEPIWTYLGTDRLAPPIAEHEPDLVLHGHAHHGTFEGRIGNVPVYNVSVPVMGQDYWVFELSGVERVTTPIH
jgi:Icc-related predicted phosphoesterase